MTIEVENVLEECRGCVRIRRVLIGQWPQVVTNVVNIRSIGHVRNQTKENSKLFALKL